MNAREIDRFLEAHESALRPLLVASNLAAWDASTSGDDDAIRRAARAAAELRKLYADAAALRRIRDWLHDDGLDPLRRRQLVVLEHDYTANQLPPELIEELEERAREIEQVLFTFRGTVEGRPVPDNEIRRLLADEGDTARRREAWEASKAVGARIDAPLRALARRRNDAARMVGFPDPYRMRLTLEEIDPAALERFAADLARRTDPLYAEEKAGLDAALADRLGIGPEALRPWHYEDPFFQEPPAAGEVGLDPLVRGRDVVALARDHFAAIGLPVDAVLERSDLHERAGKDQHAFCTDIDRAGDVRILCNVRDDARWLGTMLHELGHAAYDLGLPASLPFLLRTPAHTLATEAVAMFFGGLVRDADWLAAALDLPADRRAALAGRLPAGRARALLVFTRWALLMIRFERTFYGDPDRPDLNRVWWLLAARFQRIAPPPDADDRHDWATKPHLTVAPAYYHNYLLGEIYAAQLRATLARRAVAGTAVGDFFREALFRHGATLRWSELVRRSTGRDLEPEDFVAELETALRAA